MTALDLVAVAAWGVVPALALVTGWRRLRYAGSRAIGPAALGADVLALVLLALVVAPSVSAELEARFAGHMAQHLVLGLLAPLLLVVGRAPELVPWAVAGRHRPGVRRRLAPLPRAGRSVPAATATYLATWYLWHVPVLYDLAVRWPVLHLVEHASFLVAGAWFWTAVAPHRRRTGAPVVALFAATLGLGLLGGALSLDTAPLYDHLAGATDAARLDDQHLGGLLMWTPGGFVHLVAAVVQLTRWLVVDEEWSLPPEVAS